MLTQQNSFNWDFVQFFLAVARTGRLTAAAARLQTDHATVSRKISALEKSLEVTLFDRSPRGYALTRDGAHFLEVAEEMEALALRAKENIGGADTSIAGTVRIGAPEGFGSYFLAPRLKHLINANDGLRVELVAGSNPISLSKREADLIVAISPPKSGRLSTRKLVDFQLGLFAAKTYIAQSPAITALDDLVKHRFVGYISDLLYAPELDYIYDVHPGIESELESNNLLVQVRATRAGAGLCILPHFIAKNKRDLVEVLPEKINFTRSFWLVVHEDMKDVARVRKTIDFLLDQIDKQPALYDDLLNPSSQ